MKKFKQFLEEQASPGEMMEPNAELSSDNIDELNSRLDVLTSKPYQNAPIFLAQLRGALELFGIELPAEATKEFLSLDAELVYTMPNEELYMYITYNTRDDGFVDGYAQIVDNEELADLKDMDPEDLFGDEDENLLTPPKYLPARRDDDSGNSNEY
jgi:hypothetical protein